MAVDEALFESVINNDRKAAFRIYSWIRPTITIGYFQKADQLNLKRCLENDISIIRRITGGRAVFHQNEITYSIALKSDNTLSKKKIFSQLSQIILKGLSEIGVSASISAGNRGEMKNPNCFQATSACEITSPDGTKLVGSALLMKENVVLMQGSIPLDNSFKQMSYFLNGHESDNFQLCNSFDESDKKIVVQKFINGIGKAIQLNESQLTTQEKDVVDQLMRDKYGNDSWNFQRL